MSWQQVNRYMYLDDTPSGSAPSQLRRDLVHEVALTADLRPAVPAEIAAGFVSKRQRLTPGYAPQSARALLDWVKERVLIPWGEWRQLLAAIARDHGLGEAELLPANARKLARVTPPRAAEPLLVAVEDLPRLLTLWPEPVLCESLAGEPIAPPRLSAREADAPTSSLLGEWLRSYGPVNPSWIANALGLSPDALFPEFEDLLDLQELIQGRLVVEGREDDLCDRENFETLLRLARAAAVPAFEPLPGDRLPLFLASYQGLCRPGRDPDALWERLAQLSGYAAPAELWEEAFLPARLHRYEGAWLDALMQEGRLHWLGMGQGRVAFCLDDDLPLVRTASHAATEALRELLPDEYARYGLQALSARTSRRLSDLTVQLWEGVWQGLVSNDSMAALRAGITSGYKPPELPAPPGPSRSAGRRVSRGPLRHWMGSVLSAGNWYRLPEVAPAEDLLEERERAKDRVRVLLERYGVLFRELLRGEPPLFQWPRVFDALRLMELSGEVLSGLFFHGIPGLQFISPRAFRALQRELPEEAVWWVNACDPAACCGLTLEPLKGRLPRRVPGNSLVFRGHELVLTLLREGKELQFAAPPDDPRLPEYLAPLHVLLSRGFQPRTYVMVETINGLAATTSPYADALALVFHTFKEGEKLRLTGALGPRV
jgi:ATP-dependent helicase Lhr and Lhr-like helicase